VAKEYLFEKIIDFMKPIQAKFETISDEYVIELLKKNAPRA